MAKTLRAGCRLHNGKEVPSIAKIFMSKSGRECYVVGIETLDTSDRWRNLKAKAKVKYIDNGEVTDVDYDKIIKYL